MPDLVISDAGLRWEPRFAAEAAAQLGAECEFIGSVVMCEDRAQRALTRVWKDRVARMLSRRRLEFKPTRVRSLYYPDVLRLIAGRLRLPMVPVYLASNALFDAHVSRLLRRPLKLYFGVQEGSLWSLRRARTLGARAILCAITPHPRYEAPILDSEAARLGLSAGERSGWAGRRIATRIEAEYDAADTILCSSEYTRRTLVGAGVRADKTRAIPLAIDTEVFRPLRRNHHENNGLRVLFVGSMTPRKGLQYLLPAVKALRDGGRDVSLTLVGATGPFERLLRPDRSMYRHLGPVANHELPRVHAEHDVLVMPSLSEGFGLVAAEAMASGLPVIVSENVGCAVTDGVEGFVVPVADAGAIAQRLCVLHDHPELRSQMGKAGRARQEAWSAADYRRAVGELLRESLEVVSARGAHHSLNLVP